MLLDRHIVGVILSPDSAEVKRLESSQGKRLSGGHREEGRPFLLRMAWLLLGHLGGGQLLGRGRQKLLGGAGIALLTLGQDAGHVRHNNSLWNSVSPIARDSNAPEEKTRAGPKNGA